MKWFVYLWGIDPYESRMIGPFDTEDDAQAWVRDEEDLPLDQTGLIQVPFVTIPRD